MKTMQYKREDNYRPVMTHDTLSREQRYRASISLAKRLYADGVINETDYQKIDRLMLARFCPVLAGLYPKCL